MEVIDAFLTNFENIRIHPINDQFMAKGRDELIQKLWYFINNKMPITMVLPAFPFKSPNNKDKVLGKLPDRSEEIALEKLETFCCKIEKFYPIGVRLIIFSDGRVFNDIIGVSLEELALYKRSLQEMVYAAGYTHISFDGLENHVNSSNPVQDMMQKYNCVDIPSILKGNDDLISTYCGFKKFLQRDLALSWIGKSKRYGKEQCRSKAKQMMERNVAFSNLVENAYPHAIRLSIHAHNNAGPKYGILLLPQKFGANLLPGTPWHRVICEDTDGTIHATELRDVDRTKYFLVTKYGRPWGFKEKKAVHCHPEADGNEE